MLNVEGDHKVECLLSSSSSLIRLDRSGFPTVYTRNPAFPAHHGKSKTLYLLGTYRRGHLLSQITPNALI